MGRYTGKTCRLSVMLVLTAGFFVAELVSGYVGNSIALVSDSFSMLSDLIALCVGLVTGRISRRRRRSPQASFGYERAEVVGALSNAVFLAALYFTILVEALQRLARPEPISDASLILVVGALGLAVNLVGLLVFQNWAACCPPACCLPRAPPSPPGHPEDEPARPGPASSPAALEGLSGETHHHHQQGAAEAPSTLHLGSGGPPASQGPVRLQDAVLAENVEGGLCTPQDPSPDHQEFSNLDLASLSPQPASVAGEDMATPTMDQAGAPRLLSLLGAFTAFVSFS